MDALIALPSLETIGQAMTRPSCTPNIRTGVNQVKILRVIGFSRRCRCNLLFPRGVRCHAKAFAQADSHAKHSIGMGRRSDS